MPDKTIRLLGIVGSPRPGGNTELLVDAVLAGAQAAGASVERVRLPELDIAPCDACDGCANGAGCVIDDDMTELVEKMQASQVWVLGTPVYWWGPTAQFKTYVDRWYGLINRFRFREHRIILVVPFGDADPSTADHTVGAMRIALDYLKMPAPEVLLAPGVNDLGEVAQHAELLARARELGRQAAGN